MKVLFVISEPYLPLQMGGGLFDIDELCKQFVELGHEPEVFSTQPASRFRELYLRVARRVRIPAPLKQSQYSGYTVLRSYERALQGSLRSTLARSQYDAIILQGSRIAMLLEAAKGFRGRVMLRQVMGESVDELAPVFASAPGKFSPLDVRNVVVVSNSQFVAEVHAKLLGISSPVIYPPITIKNDHSEHREQSRKVLMVNPTRSKGVDVALALAAERPQYEFLLLESWHLDDTQREDLLRRSAGLPNVRFLPFTWDIQSVLKDVRVLLVPSQSQEAFGRVVVDAGSQSVPSLASNLGGIPEAVLDGGALVESGAALSVWIDALDRMMDDHAYWRDIAERSLRNSRRREVNPRHVAMAHLALLSQQPRFSEPSG